MRVKEPVPFLLTPFQRVGTGRDRAGDLRRRELERHEAGRCACHTPIPPVPSTPVAGTFPDSTSLDTLSSP